MVLQAGGLSFAEGGKTSGDLMNASAIRLPAFPLVSLRSLVGFLWFH
jgi:hypothetical protein